MPAYFRIILRMKTFTKSWDLLRHYDLENVGPIATQQLVNVGSIATQHLVNVGSIAAPGVGQVAGLDALFGYLFGFPRRKGTHISSMSYKLSAFNDCMLI